MPGIYLHMEIAQQAVAALSTNATAAAIFSAGGPTAAELEAIAADPNNASYLSLGAIGPDFFFFLPDFKPPVGAGLLPLAQLLSEMYDEIDSALLAPMEDKFGALARNQSAIEESATGGEEQQRKRILIDGLKVALEAGLIAASREVDVFGFLGCGVAQGYDEQTFFWSDMLHYRKTSEFGAHLWKKATALGDKRLQAYALGWISHVAADTTGHAFVNQKCGGPFRLHAQRHHLVENHMDGLVYQQVRGGNESYPMLSGAALHRRIAFEEGTGDSIKEGWQPFLDAVHDGDDADTVRKKTDRRRGIMDVDPHLPQFLADFLASSLREVYETDTTPDPSKGQCAPHPTIIEDYQPGSKGFPSADNLKATYWWLFRFLKVTTTDVALYERPKAPDVIVQAPFPVIPPAPNLDPQPPFSGAAAAHDVDLGLSLLLWLTYLAQVPEWIAAEAAAPWTSLSTVVQRKLLWAFVEVPLYNAFISLHWYLSLIGYSPPLTQEVNPGLHTLGVGLDLNPASIQTLLADPLGGLVGNSAQLNETSGRDKDPQFPHDAVTDPFSILQARGPTPWGGGFCGSNEASSEFLAPWRFPLTDQHGDTVPTEAPAVVGGPFVAGQDATVLLGGAPGNSNARAQFEAATSAANTQQVAAALLPAGAHLGDPVDYTAYLMARLTRDVVGPIANFNLDADRGYGHLCWDWLRQPHAACAPAAYRGDGSNATHKYKPPIRAGYGWCAQDVVTPTPATEGNNIPVVHDPAAADGLSAREDVKTRYLGLEPKYPTP